MAVIRRDKLAMPKGVSSTVGSNNLSLYPDQQEQFDIPFNGKNHDVYMYLSRECSGSWYPSFKHGQAAVKGIANCLLDVADERYASLKVEYLPFSESSHGS